MTAIITVIAIATVSMVIVDAASVTIPTFTDEGESSKGHQCSEVTNLASATVE
jgi:hypothetical protein